MRMSPGLKPQVFNVANSTAPQPSLVELAQAKRSSRALTLVSSWTLLPQRLKPAPVEAETAGLKACSTPRRTVNGNGESKNLCSTPWGKDFPGLKPQVFSQLYAALKGRSSTKGRFFTVQSMGVC
jgi:hypothetical protein